MATSLKCRPRDIIGSHPRNGGSALLAAAQEANAWTAQVL